MINPTGKKLQDLASKLIDGEIEGVDKYTLNKSTWLIFTDQKRWVVEYTEDNILWYNYSFFTEIFEILSMKATDNQNLIQEWFESRFLRPEVKDTSDSCSRHQRLVEDAIQNGVKDTSFVNPYFNQNVEETIQKGVKRTVDYEKDIIDEVEDTIQNGVKHIDFPFGLGDENAVEDTIQNGVKEIHRKMPLFGWQVEDAIQNGVKDTARGGDLHPLFVEDTIQNGVKHTQLCMTELINQVEHTIKKGVKHTSDNPTVGICEVEDTIQKAVKNTRFKTNRHPEVEDTLQKGIKEIKEISDLSLTSEIFKVKCKKTIKEGVKHTQFGGSAQIKSVEDTIKNGVRETNSYLGARPNVINTIQNGVKETHRQKFNLDGLVDDIIDNGVKQTKPMDEWVNSHNIISDVMDYGNIEMVGTGHATDNEMNDIIDNGVKEVRTDDGYVNHFRQNYKFNNVFENIVKEVQSDCSNNTERVNGVIRVGKKLN